MQKLIVVCGPTATGKTELAVRLCRALSGEVVSADSMQIYSELTIGTARPDETEMGGVPHHLLGFVPPEESFSVADYVTAARGAIDEIVARGRQPVVAGGTGLYITSLCDGVRFGAFKGDSEVREQLRREAEEKGGGALLARLREIDPEAAEKLHPNDVFRLTRALEIYLTTGVTKTEWERRSKAEAPAFDLRMIGLTFRNRATLYERIDRRVDRMVERGLVAEAERLWRRGLGGAQSMRAIGYKELVEHFEGRCTLAEAVAAIKQNSRRYAKRQLTWFRRDERISFLELDGLTAEQIAAAALERVEDKMR